MTKFDEEIWSNEGEWRKYMNAIYQSLTLNKSRKSVDSFGET